MSNLASLLVADSTLTITPAEPASLHLALVGIGTLAVYAVLAGWRPRRSPVAVRATTEHPHRPAETLDATTRRAA